MQNKIILSDLVAQRISNYRSHKCLLWEYSKNPQGYGLVWLPAESKMVQVHRYAFYIMHRRWPFPVARHTCDNPPCFNPRHIIEGTRAQNANDMIVRGRHKTCWLAGENHRDATLTDEEVTQIRIEYREGGSSCAELGRRYNISRQYAWDIANFKARKSHRHFPRSFSQNLINQLFDSS